MDHCRFGILSTYIRFMCLHKRNNKFYVKIGQNLFQVPGVTGTFPLEATSPMLYVDSGNELTSGCWSRQISSGVDSASFDWVGDSKSWFTLDESSEMFMSGFWMATERKRFQSNLDFLIDKSWVLIALVLPNDLRVPTS